MEEKNEVMVKDVNELSVTGASTQKILTTITDGKTLFNLDNNVDYKLNDCKGETIKVKDYMIKVFESEINHDGELEKVVKKVTIIIDDKGKSYVTASKVFNNQFIKAIQYFGENEIKENGIVIKIKEVSLKNSSNKALGFELV